MTPPPATPLWVRVLLDMCWIWAVVAISIATARVFAHDGHLLLVWANSFSLYLYLPSALVLLFAIWQSRRQLAVVSGLLVLAQAAWVGPDFLPGQRNNLAEKTRGLRVFSANLYTTNTTREGLLDEISSSDADIVLLQELSPAWQRDLSDRGLLEKYPHTELHAREDSFGAGVLSKHPFVDATTWSAGGVPTISVVIQWQTTPVRFCNWHPLPPRKREYVAIWNAQYEALFQWLRQHSGPMLLVGDFNATQHARWMKRLSRAGYQSAHAQTGRGYAITYPNGTSYAPPIRIDHALMSEHFRCRGIREGFGRGSDHKPLIAEFELLGTRSLPEP